MVGRGASTILWRIRHTRPYCTFDGAAKVQEIKMGMGMDRVDGEGRGEYVEICRYGGGWVAMKRLMMERMGGWGGGEVGRWGGWEGERMGMYGDEGWR